MRVLVFQHIPVEHPGIFRDFLAADGIPWDVVELEQGEPIPRLEGYDALWVMGGPMDVWEEAEHPWMVAEKQAIRDWVGADKPFLGICLGHQLLADALGGTVGPGRVPEVGILPIELTAAGSGDPLFDGLPATNLCLQWHGAEVQAPPPGGAVLATSADCPVQAIRVGHAAYGLQCHVEVTAATVDEWGCVDAYAASLEDVMGADALGRFRDETARHLPGLNAAARRIYDNFMALARSAAA